MKQKNFNRRKRKEAGLGVFLLVAGLMWFAGLKLFGGIPGAGLGIAGSGKSGAEAVFTSGEHYPVMVMMDNAPESRDFQSGLSDALVVYETLAEGGATRFALLFAGAPASERIGPVRSARPYFVEVAAGWSAFYLHAGGSPEGLELIPKTDVTDLNEISGLGPIYFWRDNGIPRPHNLFTSGGLVALALSDFALRELPAEKLLWEWSEDFDEDDGEPATSISVDFSEGETFDVSYAYTSESKTYPRRLGGREHLDAGAGAVIAPANVIVQRVPAEGFYPSGYERVIIQVTGEGEALVFRNGTRIRGRWKKEDANAPTKWLDEDGDVIPLAPGSTWVEIVPGERAVSYN